MQILDYDGLKIISSNISNLSNPNMVINPDFSINQRGKLKYEMDNYSRKYTVDRWCIKGKSTVDVVDNGIKFTKTSEAGEAYCTITQVIENCSKIEGETLILSVSYMDNNEKKIGILKINKGWSYTDETHELSRVWILGYIILAVYARPDKMLEVDIHIAKTAPLNFSCIFNYIKLEVSNIATIFVPPDITIERIKCMRYYQKIGIDENPNLILNIPFRPISYYIYAVNDTRNFLDFVLYFNIKLRTIPTVKLFGISNNDTGYSIAYVKGHSPDKTRIWKYNTTHANEYLVQIKVTAEDGNITDDDFDKRNLVFYNNSGIEVDAEIYEYKNNL